MARLVIGWKALADEHHTRRDVTAIVTLYYAFMSDDSSTILTSGKVLALGWAKQSKDDMFGGWPAHIMFDRR